MYEQLFYFRPGEEARMLARCQIDIAATGRGSILMTYPIKGYPWRRNIRRFYELQISAAEQAFLVSEVRRLRVEHPGECLSNDELWNDSSEKGNGITRDRSTNTLCHTLGISAAGEPVLREYFAMREDAPAFVNSPLYRTMSGLAAPYEAFDGRVQTA